MLSLAYFSPLPPARTGIADYSRELLPFLARRARVTLFTDAPPTDDVRSLAQYPLADYGFRRWGYDAALFQMGNSEHHAPMVRVFRRYPGILVLHDAVLHHFLADQTAGAEIFLPMRVNWGMRWEMPAFTSRETSNTNANPIPSSPCP